MRLQLINVIFSFQDINGDQLINEMKWYAAIVVIHTKHSDVEIVSLLEVTRWFVHKVQKELEASNEDVSHVAKRKNHSRFSGSIRTPQFVQN